MLKAFIYIIFLFLVIQQGSAQECFSGWIEADNACYKFFDPYANNEKLDWLESQKYCQALGGNLASFQSADGSNAVATAFGLSSNPRKFWIGFSNLNKPSYQWIDNSPITWTNWIGGQPDNFNNIENCAETRNDQRWNDANCYVNQGWLCKISKGVIPPSTSIVVASSYPVTDCEDKGDSKLDWFQYNQKCYYANSNLNSWQSSEAFCKQNGGFLVSIHSRNELFLLTSRMGKLNAFNYFWIGLSELSTATGYVWSDGTPVNFANWRGGEPNSAAENCVEMASGNSLWNDLNCGQRLVSVCERLKSDAADTNTFVQPLSFGDGKPCSDGYSTFGVTTTGGSGDTTPCVFPFKYNGKLYYECITLDKDGPWCATTADYDRDQKWGNCVGIKCFKFVDDLLTYEQARDTCVAQDQASRLASITNIYEQAFITANLKYRVYNNFFVGGWCSGSSYFRWEDNSDFSYSNWAFNKPSDFLNSNERCITVTSDPKMAGLWSNINCGSRGPYICSKPAFDLKYTAVCEYGTAQLRCPINTKIVIVKADFGRNKYSSVCNDYFYEGNCTSLEDTTEKMRIYCGNRQTCDQYVDGDIFTDNCFGNTKLLRVWYQCIGDVFTIGGNANGRPCRFPFKYNNVLHYQCTYEDAQNFNNKRWCRTNEDTAVTLEWGNCPASPQEMNGCDKEGYQSIDGGRNCYKLVSKQPRTWDSAQDFCKTEGGNLVIIRDAFEQAYVSLIKTGSVSPEWIGLKNNENQFYWSDNTQLTYSNWPVGFNAAVGQQNNCVFLENKNSLWNTTTCSAQNDFICKITKVDLTPKCFTGWTEADNNCYKIFDPLDLDLRLNWFEAEDFCRSLGGYLASFSSSTDSSTVAAGQQLSLRSSPTWIGFSKHNSTSTFQWIDNSPLTFLNWDATQPDNYNNNEYCTEMRTSQKWNDINCYVERGWTCKIPKGVDPSIRPIEINELFPTTECENTDNSDLKWIQWRNKCYYASPPIQSQYLTWQSAESFCNQNGGYLVSIHSVNENQFITSKLAKRLSRVWIGLSQLSGNGFLWSDGSPISFTYWAPGEPNNQNNENCGELFPASSWWNDNSCGAKNPFICEKLKTGEVNPNTFVQPLSFGGGKPCPDGYSTFGVTTTGGSSDSEPCVFPFKYKGTFYYECITLDRSNPWCSTTADYDRDGKWGNCVGIKCFKFIEEKRTFLSGRTYCINEGAQLASISGEYEQAFITASLRNKPSNTYFTGGWTRNQGNDFFEWSDNSAFRYTKWAPGKPDGSYLTTTNRCISVSRNVNTPGLWENIDCNAINAFICAKPAFNVKYAAECEDWPSNARPVQLRCETGTKLLVLKADFGRDKYSSACGDYFYDGNCTSVVATTEIVRNLCVGLQNCDVTPTNLIFPDPCYGQQKLLRVWYQCVGNVLTTGGNANGKPCRFPFKYKNVDHFQCTYEDVQNFNNQRWCRTNEDTAANLEWGNCPISPQENNGCDKVGYQSIDGGQNCYKLVSRQQKTWNSASDFCKSDGANLASIRDGFEQAYMSLIKTSSINAEWIGLKSSSLGVFTWADSWPFSYTNWLSVFNPLVGQQNKCAFLNDKDSFWNSQNCDAINDFICKISKEANPGTTIAPPKCAEGWSEAESSCYKLFDPIDRNQQFNWFEAEAFCRASSGHLASFRSKDTLNFISLAQQLSTKTKGFWIGYNILDKDRGYQWSDDSLTSFSNWNLNQPDNYNNIEECAEIRSNQGWNDINCYLNRGYMCKIPRGITPPLNPVVNQTFEVTQCEDKGNSTLPWIQYREKCYYASPDIQSQWLTWKSAEALCKSNGGFLVSIHSLNELKFITSKITKNLDRFWIGLNQLTTASGFIWSDGSPVNFVNWARGEPNGVNGGENCVEMFGSDSFWNDGNCGSRNGYICERLKSDAANTDNVVQPLSFGDGRACPIGYSTFGIPTTGGNAEGKPCVFPFKYKEVLYYECITIDRNTPWCATTNDYFQDGKWGYCAGTKCFKFVETPTSYTDARAYCAADQSTLASITNDYEQAFVTAKLRNHTYNSYFTGGTTPGYSGFFWDDNTDFTYTKWAPGKPGPVQSTNDRCIAVSTNPSVAGLWNNIDCSLKSSFICSKNSYSVKYAAECEDWPSNARPVQLRCEIGTKLLVLKADFGRDKYSSACGDYFYDGNCTSVVATTEIVRNLCGGLQYCNVTPSNQIFPDPCYGQKKLLRVWYQCIGEVLTTGGNANGKPCRFPFKYNNFDHYQCTYEDAQNFNNQRWCRTNEDTAANLEWGNCPASPQEKNGCNKAGYQSIDNGQNCYKLFNDQQKTWDNAELTCRSDGGNLVSIRDGFEQAYISLVKTGSSNFEWIGLKNNGSMNFFWSDNWQFSYSNWISNLSISTQQQNSCGFLNDKNNMWNVNNCNSLNDFICKISKEIRPFFTTASPGICPGDDWISYGTHCYQIVRVPRSYAEAKFDCSNKEAKVVSITSRNEMDFITNSVDAKPVVYQIWIGLERQNSTGFYEWEDGTRFTFNSFAFNNHTEKCVYMYNQQWFDSDCFINRRIYVCKTNKSFTATTRTTTYSTSTISQQTIATNNTVQTSASVVTKPIEIIETPKPNTNSKSNGGTVAGVVIGLLVGVALVTIVTLYMLKKKGKINSYLPTFLSKKSFNGELIYSKQEDSDLVSIRNKNYN